MIGTFRNSDSENVYSGKPPRRFLNIADQARARLRRLDAAESLTDLGAIPGNKLEALKGDRKGQHSIRINDQWRICFRWREGKAYDVEIVDYH
jgi:proteic killer suppression protein